MALTKIQKEGIETLINNNADNRVITGSGTANTLNAESGVTIDGSGIMAIQGSGQRDILVGSTNAGGASIALDGDSNGDASGGDYALIRHNTDGNLEITTRNPSGATATIFKQGSTESLRIDSSGNFTFSKEASSNYPTQQIKWSNDSTTTNGFYIAQHSDRNGRIWHEQGLSLVFGTSNTERLRIDESGRLLIGDTSSDDSTSMLQVKRANNSTIRVASSDATATNFAAIDFAPANSVQGAAIICVADGTFSSSSNQSAHLRFVTRNSGSDAEKMRIDSSGRVMIGTTSLSPANSYSNNLVVSEASGDAGISIHGNNSNSNYASIYLGDAGAASRAYLEAQLGSGTSTNFTIGSQGVTRFLTNGAERMRIDSSGKVSVKTNGLNLENATATNSRAFAITNAGGTTGWTFGNGVTASAHQFVIYDNSAGAARMVIDSSGNTRIAEAIAQNTNAKLAVASSGINPRVFDAHATHASFQGITMQSVGSRNTTNGSYRHFQCVINGVADKLRIADSGNVTNSNNSYGSISDERLKENIVDASSQWDDIKALRIRKFNFKSLTDPDKKPMLGVVAQEAELVCPNLVTSEVTLQEGVEQEYKSFKYSVLYMKAIKCLQEAQAKIETLETKVAALEAA